MLEQPEIKETTATNHIPTCPVSFLNVIHDTFKTALFIYFFIVFGDTKTKARECYTEQVLGTKLLLPI